MHGPLPLLPWRDGKTSKGRAAKVGKFYLIPLHGATLESVDASSFPKLVFEHDSRPWLSIEGTFRLGTQGEQAEYARHEDYATDLLEGLVGQIVIGAKSHQGTLWVEFDNDILLVVPDDQYESWHFGNRHGMRVDGGAGATAIYLR